MADAHKNFAYSTIATAPSPAASGTSLVVAAGQGTLFPAVPFNATIWPTGTQPTSANAEIVRVTNISTDTFTITRTQEGTAARTIVVGDQIAAAITAKTLTDIESNYAATWSPFFIFISLYDFFCHGHYLFVSLFLQFSRQGGQCFKGSCAERARDRLRP
jgi:hypothetical protein